MNTAKTLITWLALVAVTAGAGIAGIQLLNKQLGLQAKVASFGKTR